jgi:pilus assembly protein CpaE
VADAISIFVVVDAGVDRADVEKSLPKDSDIEIAAVADGVENAWVRLHESSNDLLLIALAGQSEAVLGLIEAAVRERPRRPVVVMAHASANGFTRRVFGAGADDLIMLPAAPDEVGFALRKAVARKAGGAESASLTRAPLICVLGPKGGTGKTLTSTSLAVALAGLGKSVVLVDLDLQFGDVGLCLGIAPERTIFDLVRTGGSLDEDKLNGFLLTHEASGVRALLAPARPDQAAVVSVEFLREVYGTLRTMADYIIVDTPPGFTPEVIATIDSASVVCMVGMLDALSLKNTKLGLETLDLMGVPADRVTLILNRAGSRVGISDADVEAIMGREPEILVPSDRDIPRAVNEGKSILLTKPQSEASRAYRSLASRFVGSANGTEAQRTGRVFRRIGVGV